MSTASWWVDLGLHALEGANAVSLAELRARYADDFLGFCALLDILPKEGGRVAFAPNAIQRAYDAARTPRDVVLKSRQVGLTTLEQARDLWTWLMRDGVRVVVVCQSITGSGPLNELSERFALMLDALRKRSGLRLEFASESRSGWVLAETGSSLRIIEAGASEAAAQKKGRAGTIHRLHATEVAFWEHAGETLNALLECVPASGSVVFESTPNGVGSDSRESPKDAGGGATFYWLCQDAEAGRSAYRLHFFPWFAMAEYATPLEAGEVIEPQTEREVEAAALGATPEQLKWYRQKVTQKGQDLVDQEYPTDPKTAFLVSGRPFFDRAKTAEVLAACRDPDEVAVIRRPGADGTLRVWYDPEPGRSYVVSVDTSEGSGGDRGGAQVWERATGLHCATLVGQFKPAELAREAEKLGYRFFNAEIAVERNNHGAAVLQELDREGEDKRTYPRIWRDHDGKPGWLTSAASRPAALAALEQAMREGAWATEDAELMGEVRTFIVSKRGKPEAASGAKDDLVMMAAIGWDVISRLPPTATISASLIGADPPRAPSPPAPAKPAPPKAPISEDHAELLASVCAHAGIGSAQYVDALAIRMGMAEDELVAGLEALELAERVELAGDGDGLAVRVVG